MIPYYEHRSSDLFRFNSLSWQWRTDPPGWGMHLHHQIEVVYMVEGQADVTVDKDTVRLCTGDVAIIFPHCIHGYKLVCENDTLDHMQGLMFTPQMAGEYSERLSHKLPRRPFLRAEELNDETKFVLHQLFVDRKDRHLLVTKSYLQLLFSLIWPQLEAVNDAGDRQDDTPHRTIRYVMEQSNRPLQAKEVAAALGISQSHLARIFSGHLHMGFNEYLNQLRVRRAEDLLRSTHLSITEIMSEVGFESQSTFNRAFQRINGVTPREYRRQTQPVYLEVHGEKELNR